ncbi:hypothetical protein VDGL01_10537 [Verticillium dahliae]
MRARNTVRVRGAGGSRLADYGQQTKEHEQTASARETAAFVRTGPTLKGQGPGPGPGPGPAQTQTVWVACLAERQEPERYEENRAYRLVPGSVGAPSPFPSPPPPVARPSQASRPVKAGLPPALPPLPPPFPSRSSPSPQAPSSQIPPPHRLHSSLALSVSHPSSRSLAGCSLSCSFPVWSLFQLPTATSASSLLVPAPSLTSLIHRLLRPATLLAFLISALLPLIIVTLLSRPPFLKEASPSLVAPRSFPRLLSRTANTPTTTPTSCQQTVELLLEPRRTSQTSLRAIKATQRNPSRHLPDPAHPSRRLGKRGLLDPHLPQRIPLFLLGPIHRPSACPALSHLLPAFDSFDIRITTSTSS